jgi:hypothetical protein
MLTGTHSALDILCRVYTNGQIMQLADWMHRKNLRDQAMADLLTNDLVQVERSMVSRYRRRTHRPSWPVVERIIEVTGGEVTADDFVNVQAAE